MAYSVLAGCQTSPSGQGHSGVSWAVESGGAMDGDSGEKGADDFAGLYSGEFEV